MSTTEMQPTFTARTFAALWNFVVEVIAGWADRWNSEHGICFRGADDATFNLNPSLLRHPYPSEAAALCHLENTLWGEFRLRSMPLLGRQVHTDWEALLIMQQYGFPTRLLDWSRALAVAAYFAVRDLNVQKDGAVWIMAPRHLMEVRGISGSWRTIIDNECLNSLRPRVNTVGLEEFCAQTPVALSPDQLVSRMIAQRGIYTLHSFERFALERLAVADRIKHENGCFLHKVIIPEAAKVGFRADIRVLAGVSEESLFPDLDGLARDIVADHREKALQREGRPTSR